MVVWIGMFVFLLVVKYMMGPLETDKQRKAYLIIAGGTLALLLALRGENYGDVYDLRVYMAFYEETALKDWSSLFINPQFEVGFVVLNKILSLFFKSGHTIVVFHAFFCIYFVCRFIYKNTNEVFWAFLFFYSLGNMGFFLTGLRQAIAICICLYAIEKAQKKKLISFAVLVVLAYTIHESALVFAIMYPMLRMEILRRDKRLMIFPIAFIILFSAQIIDFGQTLSSDVQAEETATLTFNGIVPILIYALTIIGQMLFVQNRKESSEDASGLTRKDTYVGFSMTATGLGLYFLRFYEMVLERISFYYLQGAPIALADVVGSLKRSRSGRIIEIVIVILCLVLFYRRLGDADYANYIFFWEATA